MSEFWRVMTHGGFLLLTLCIIIAAEVLAYRRDKRRWAAWSGAKITIHGPSTDEVRAEVQRAMAAERRWRARLDDRDAT